MTPHAVHTYITGQMSRSFDIYRRYLETVHCFLSFSRAVPDVTESMILRWKLHLQSTLINL